MRTVYTDSHRLQHGHAELNDGQLVPCFEKPERADLVLARVRRVGLGAVLEPEDFGRAPLARVHAGRYLDFLETAWDAWVAEHGPHDALPLNWAVRGMRSDIEPAHIDGRLSYYSFDAGTPLTAGTWQAVTGSANVALTGQRLVAGGERAAFALCRPPGHHAAADYYGGYCFLNNAAIAAQAFRDQGAARVALLDIDYHHGNGGQTIFYHRDDVLFLSIHADPRWEFPYFLGHADEHGAGPGEGCNVNYPLPWGTDYAGWAAALDRACRRIADYAPDALVVSLGVDTFKDDPISRFRLDQDAYPRIGERLARLRLPTLFVMEGGYAVEAIGVNAVNVLVGFEEQG
ncbi:MAG: histone deacetylase family protein [Candidatus Competibacterales bacterium]|nr:histone deacetylase family protein [Candidatus Competibacterales bacterium]